MPPIDDQQLLCQFENCSLPKEQWTHTAHVRVAYLYLRGQNVEDVINTMRAGIKALNAAHGTLDTPTGGYHETITQAWVRVIASLLTNGSADESSEAFIQRHMPLGHSNLLGQFYSKELLMSVKARAEFVEPDLTRLP